jgi:hypothetical protein
MTARAASLGFANFACISQLQQKPQLLAAP